MRDIVLEAPSLEMVKFIKEFGQKLIDFWRVRTTGKMVLEGTKLQKENVHFRKKFDQKMISFWSGAEGENDRHTL